MFILSSFKTRGGVPWILIITLINLALLGEPAEALKCYQCSCWNDCVVNKNLFREKECAPNLSACFTKLPEKEGENFISKSCTKSKGPEDDARKMQAGKIYKYCYTDLCNDQEAGGMKSPRSGEGGNSTNGGVAVARRAQITGQFFVPPVMIMAYVGHWLIN